MMINSFRIMLFSDTKLCQGHLVCLVSRLQVITSWIYGDLLILSNAPW
jgi:hypothetical protein